MEVAKTEIVCMRVQNSIISARNKLRTLINNVANYYKNFYQIKRNNICKIIKKYSSNFKLIKLVISL